MSLSNNGEETPVIDFCQLLGPDFRSRFVWPAAEEEEEEAPVEETVGGEHDEEHDTIEAGHLKAPEMLCDSSGIAESPAKKTDKSSLSPETNLETVVSPSRRPLHYALEMFADDSSLNDDITLQELEQLVNGPTQVAKLAAKQTDNKRAETFEKDNASSDCTPQKRTESVNNITAKVTANPRSTAQQTLVDKKNANQTQVSSLIQGQHHQQKTQPQDTKKHNETARDKTKQTMADGALKTLLDSLPCVIAPAKKTLSPKANLETVMASPSPLRRRLSPHHAVAAFDPSLDDDLTLQELERLVNGRKSNDVAKLAAAGSKRKRMDETNRQVLQQSSAGSDVGGTASSVVLALSVLNIKDLPKDITPLVCAPRRQTNSYRGVCRVARKGRDKWQSQIIFSGRKYFLGTFDSEWDAAAIHAWAHLVLYGEEATRKVRLEGEEAAAAYKEEKKDIAAGKIIVPPPKPPKKKQKRKPQRTMRKPPGG